MATARDLTATSAAFLQLACRYWFSVFPRIRKEANYWTDLAGRIPSQPLRRVALDSLRVKRGNIEGAAAFAALVPRTQRASVVRMLVAWQAAYDYVDTVAEQPSVDRRANGRQLHMALLAALSPGAHHGDYYAHHEHGDDGGYLESLVDTVRTVYGTLPGHGAVAASVQRAAMRIVSYQSFNQHDHHALARWADLETPPSSGLYWWETAAAGASSLAVLALLAIAQDARASASHVAAIERAYFPWIGALHTLLDSLIDLNEDAEAGQPSLLAYYASEQDAATRIQMLAARSLHTARSLPRGRQHLLILAAMASFYLTAPEAASCGADTIARSVIETLGLHASPSMVVLGLRRRAARMPATHR